MVTKPLPVLVSATESKTGVLKGNSATVVASEEFSLVIKAFAPTFKYIESVNRIGLDSIKGKNCNT